MNKKIIFSIIFSFFIINKISSANIVSSLFISFLKEPIKEGAKNIYNKVGFSNICLITGGLFLGSHLIDKSIEKIGGKENIENFLKKIALNAKVNNHNRGFLSSLNKKNSIYYENNNSCINDCYKLYQKQFNN